MNADDACELGQIETPITDSGLPQSQESDLQDAGIRVIRA